MRALIHVQVRFKQASDGSEADEVAKRLSLMRDWWPKREQQQLDSHIVSNTHLLLARIPPLDRKMAIDSYGFTLYHGLTKSWALVCFPDHAVVDIRVFNPDPEDLKDACSALIRDIKALEKESGGEVPAHIRLNLKKIDLLVGNREDYEARRTFIAEMDAEQLDQLISDRERWLEAFSFHPGVIDNERIEKPYSETTIEQREIPNTTQLSISFPRKIIVLQPDVPERAFEGTVIDGHKTFYSFKKRAPESIVALILIIVGIVLLVAPMPGPSVNDVIDRICTAFIATGIFTIFGVLVISQGLRDSALIEWQSL